VAPPLIRVVEDIARALGLTDGAIRGYVSAILAKLGVTNRTDRTW
jgi:DNA-binding NarL/FixJ family response regulator